MKNSIELADDLLASGVACEAAARWATPWAVLKLCFVLTLLLATVAPPALGQALPAAEASPISTGFALPLTAGTLQYAVSASESLIWGYYGNSGAATATNVSGDLAYISNSKRSPFSMVLAGGHSFNTGGQASFTFMSLELSKVANIGRWNIVLSDGVSYMPGTWTTGLSGVPGVGDLGVTPPPVAFNTGQGVLTNYSTIVTNTASGSIQRQLTGKTYLQGSGSSTIMRFLGNSSNDYGLDSNLTNGGGGISHQYSVRNTLGGNYAYSAYSYSGNTFGISAPGFNSQTISAVYTHKFTPRLSLNASAGPQWTILSYPGAQRTLSAFANVLGAYDGRFSHGVLGYVRSTNSGYGVIGGALSDSVMVSANRTFARVWNGALTGSFSRTANLTSPGVNPYRFHTALAGVQISRAIARSFSTYASYTFEDQSSQGSGPVADLFRGQSQVVGFGLTYAPMAVHFGRP